MAADPDGDGVDSDEEAVDSEADGTGDTETDETVPGEAEEPVDAEAAASPDGEEEQWRFSLEEIDERQEAAAAEDTGGNVAGSLARRQPLEPGDVNRENALFVTLGVLLIVVLIAAVIFGF